MSSRPRISFHHTLAFRLTLWYAGIFSLTSCVAFLMFYLLFISVIRDRVDRDLLEQEERFSSVLASQGMGALRNAAVIETQAAGERKIFFRLFSRSGQMFSSSNMSYWRDIDMGSDAVSQLAAGRSRVFDTTEVSGRKNEVRVLYSIIGPGVVLQLGQSMESSSRFIETFKDIFIITMAFLLALAAFIGWFMAKKALSGLEEVTHTAQRISRDALGERVPIKHRGHEIDLLATTFNRMLDRIENLVTGIKEMSDNIAHDLKSPLTKLRGSAEVALTTDAPLEEYRIMAADTIEECDRLLDTINAMLVISRTEAGVGELQMEDLDAAEVVREACDLFQPLAEEGGVSLACRVPYSCPSRGDVGMIQRMVANLVDNAVKYTPSGGAVDVAVKEKNRNLVSIAVKDTGIGISQEDLPRIFERFYRSDPSRSQAGAGLGLSLARAVARAHGGEIYVTSAPGKGSMFAVILPKTAQPSS